MAISYEEGSLEHELVLAIGYHITRGVRNRVLEIKDLVGIDVEVEVNYSISSAGIEKLADFVRKGKGYTGQGVIVYDRTFN